jgi:Glycine zipper
MMQLEIRRWMARGAALAALVASLGAAERATGQYYYQPPPSYYQNDTATGTVTGGAFGAITGALLGGHSHRGEGALIGAGVGALTGNVLGRAQDQADERRAANGAAVAAGLNQQAAAQAVTNYDLVGMARAGVGDDVIISTIQSRGARLDMSPQGVIALKQSGVSDRVLLAAQNMAAGPSYVGGPTYVAGPPPTTVIVTPGPPHYWWGPGPYWHSHVYYRHHW